MAKNSPAAIKLVTAAARRFRRLRRVADLGRDSASKSWINSHPSNWARSSEKQLVRELHIRCWNCGSVGLDAEGNTAVALAIDALTMTHRQNATARCPMTMTRPQYATTQRTIPIC